MTGGACSEPGAADGYPRMPARTCFGSADLLAACYPELRYAAGTLRVRRDGRPHMEMPHAWCVCEDGAIVDATLRPRPGDTFAYAEDPAVTACRSGFGWSLPGRAGSLTAAGFAEMTASLGPDARRGLIEAAGDEMADRLGLARAARSEMELAR